MSHRWLFRVNVANERETGETKKARGLGHAMKCLSLANAVRDAGGKVKFSIEGSDDVALFFEKRGVPFYITSNHHSVIEQFDPDIIVADINYLDREKMDIYREAGTVVNLAPRGECKYYADLSFNSAQIEDVPKPPKPPLQEWYAGPEYAILNPEFVGLRKRIDTSEWTPERDGVIVQMGGVDQSNITGTVLNNLLFDTFSDYQFTIVAGPFNPHMDELRNLCKPYNNVSLLQDPDDFAKTVADHELGIFATGISTYEAMAVGVPSINLGLTTFHDSRGELLENAGLIAYMGRYDQLTQSSLNETLRSLLSDDEYLIQMRQRGLNAVDGGACDRIVKTVLEHTTLSP